MANTQLSLNQTIMQPNWQNYLQQVLGEKKEKFVQACISAVACNNLIKDCDPTSIITASMSAAVLNLSTNGNTRQAYLIPYNNKATGKKECQFQIGVWGLIQLAQRTGQYVRINAVDVRSGELQEDMLSGDIKLVRANNRETLPLMGYVGYIKLVNGFEKAVYMTIEEINSHKEKYNKTKGGGLWETEFEKMAKKTVLKQVLKYGPMSEDMEKALTYDQSVLRPNFEKNSFEVDYVDRKTLKSDVNTESDIANESIVVEANESEEAV